VNAISQNGAVQTRLEALKQQNDSRFGDVEQLVSREVDADLAQSMVKLSQTQTAYQAAVQSGAQIMKLSLLDYV
jgi:flagellar hook-associated protein 3 FlgL